VDGKGWILAEDLLEGDKLQKSNGDLLTIDNIEIVKLQEKVIVYNFEVADFHTYFVTDLGVWVHNTNTKDCPIYHGTRVKWDIKTNASDKRSYNFGGAQHTAYQDPKTGLYWVAVRAEEAHGKTFQVYKRDGKNLVWQADANELAIIYLISIRATKVKSLKEYFKEEAWICCFILIRNV
jgi:hypothetical protein